MSFFLYNALKILIVANIPVPVSPTGRPRLQGHAVSFSRDAHGAAGRLTGHVEAGEFYIAAADRETLDSNVNYARVDCFDDVIAKA